MKLVLLSRVLFYATLASVLALALYPTEQLPAVSGWDKAHHVVAFAALATLATPSFPRHRLDAHIGLFAFGVCIELLQAFTPGRVADWRDVLANITGLLLGAGLIRGAMALIRPVGN